MNKEVESLSNQSEPITKAKPEAVRASLVALKAEINQSIREYPKPIPACDDQFNHLIARRATIAQEIIRLDRILG